MRILIALLCLAGPAAAGGTPSNGPILDLPACSGFEVRCFGTEPFWGLTFTAGGAVWSEMGGPEGVPMSFSHSGDAAATTFRTSTGIRGTISWVPARDCSDGMSDFRYPFRLRFTALPVQKGGTLDLSTIKSLQPDQRSLCCRIEPRRP